MLKYIYMKRQKVSSIFQMKDTFSQIRKVSSIFQMKDTFSQIRKISSIFQMEDTFCLYLLCALLWIFLFLSNPASTNLEKSRAVFIRICVYAGAKNLSYYFSCPSPDRQNRLFSASANPSDSFLSMDGGQSGAGCSCGGQHRSNRICPPYTRLRQTVWFWP